MFKHRYLIVLLAALMLLTVPMMVTRAASFTVDTSGILDNAATLFNGLFPAFVIIIGFSFGIGLIKWIVSTLRNAFGA
jgi:hypothetical protein